MDLLQTAPGFPFAVPKGWTPFALPRVDIEALLEACRKNTAALTSANQVALEGWQSLAQRQGELLSSTVDQCGTVAKEALAAASFAERAKRQADATGQVYRSALARFLDLFDIATRTNAAAIDIINTRLTEGIQEFGALLAAPSRSASTVAAVADTVVDSAATVAEGEGAMRSAVADAADETEAMIAPATPPVAALDVKPSRRPPRR